MFKSHVGKKHEGKRNISKSKKPEDKLTNQLLETFQVNK